MTDDVVELWAGVSAEDQHTLLSANTAAREVLRQRDRAYWLEVGRGLSVVREEALRRAGTNNIQHPRYRRAQALLLDRLPDLTTLVAKDSKGCNHAIWMFKNWSEVEVWLLELEPESFSLNHPTSIHRRYHRKERPQDDTRGRIEDVDDLTRAYPELVEELIEMVREEVTAKVNRDRSQGIMTRDTFDKLVVCLEQSTAEAAPEMLEVVRKLGWMLVREEVEEAA